MRNYPRERPQIPKKFIPYDSLLLSSLETVTIRDTADFTAARIAIPMRYRLDMADRWREIATRSAICKWTAERAAPAAPGARNYRWKSRFASTYLMNRYVPGSSSYDLKFETFARDKLVG